LEEWFMEIYLLILWGVGNLLNTSLIIDFSGSMWLLWVSFCIVFLTVCVKSIFRQECEWKSLYQRPVNIFWANRNGFKFCWIFTKLCTEGIRTVFMMLKLELANIEGM
jgi:hypothetical protein